MTAFNPERPTPVGFFAADRRALEADDSSSEESSVNSENSSHDGNRDLPNLFIIGLANNEDGAPLGRDAGQPQNGIIVATLRAPSPTERIAEDSEISRIKKLLIVAPLSMVCAAALSAIRANIGYRALALAGATSMQDVGQSIVKRHALGSIFPAYVIAALACGLPDRDLEQLKHLLYDGTDLRTQIPRQLFIHLSALLTNEIGFALTQQSSDTQELDRALGRHVAITGLALLQASLLLAKSLRSS